MTSDRDRRAHHALAIVLDNPHPAIKWIRGDIKGACFRAKMDVNAHGRISLFGSIAPSMPLLAPLRWLFEAPRRLLRWGREALARPAGQILLAAAAGALLSWIGLTLWWQSGQGPQAVLPAAVRPQMDSKTGRVQKPLTFANQEAFDRTLARSLESVDLPSMAQRAALQILPSVVHLRIEGESKEISSGSGVVIKDDGTVLTNFHVVAEAKPPARLVLTFADGTESVGQVLQVFPDKDLAIVKPQSIPDDLQPATLSGSGSLLPGDIVVAVGFPFGEVVGIVTAIYSPSKARTFVGIGFATTMDSAGSAMGVPPF